MICELGIEYKANPQYENVDSSKRKISTPCIFIIKDLQ